jgi:mannan endo-1,4-beta-mannosidase
MLVEASHARSDLKIPALTETGGQQWDLSNSEFWWTKFLYRGLIGTRSSGGQVAWALTWRNWSATDHAAPYPGHPSAMDFIEFKDQPMIHFEDEIPFNLYTWP